MRRVGALGLVAALAAILVSPLPAHAEDASGAVTYNAGNGYSFEKLSHPTVGTSQPDGIVDYQGNGAVAVPGAMVTRPTTKAIAARATLGRLRAMVTGFMWAPAMRRWATH
mgnify:FL=1